MPKSAQQPMKWTETQEQALALTFEGRWTQTEIAQKCAISRRTLCSWLAHPDFTARLEALRGDLALALRDVAYADKAQRIIGLAQVAESARRAYEERTWLREVRPTQDGPIINESFNSAAHSAFRGALDDIAKEMGQRKADVALNQQAVMRRYILEPRT